MGYSVTYHCPRCETIVELEREGYLADRSVTPYPLEGWTYVDADGEGDVEDADGVRFICGEAGTLRDDDASGCGEPFYLSYVRFENGEEVEPTPESEYVRLSR
ncbi:hypothetical protein [Haloplanus halobius]|uniref:hypothetical protein n=1 Tax=Haloplanus halobius TaxID=2934938 RepID=UPI00200FAD8D|nr:hypothetical protein [Haloplanus sp. XH21]